MSTGIRTYAPHPTHQVYMVEWEGGIKAYWLEGESGELGRRGGGRNSYMEKCSDRVYFI